MVDPILDSLNARQKEAVQIKDGPLLILAGAGSGKTKCLTHRIAHLMREGVAGDKILAVTFTNKAANEMKNRIERLLQSLNESFRMPSVGTFHATCVRMLRQHIEHMGRGYNKNFVIFDTDDSRQLVTLLLKERGYDTKEIKPKAIQSHISAAKNQLLSPSGYAESVESNRFTRAVTEIFPLYQKRLLDHNALDFDDLLQKTVELLEQCDDVLQYYRKKWHYLMVDEYQDTNFAQYRLVRLLSDEHQNICVIGDDHQSIYSFRGADYTNILNFEHDFPSAHVIKLEQNYRSTANILNNANNLIGHNESGREKNLWTENEAGDPVVLQQVYSEKDEGNTIAQQIRDLVSEDKASHADFAILYRMNAQGRAIEEALMRHQIPYQIIGGTRFFDRREIKDVVAYLRLIFNPRDDIALLRIINVPTRSIGPATMEKVKEYSQHYSLSLFEVLLAADEIADLSASKQQGLQDFARWIKSLHEQAAEKTVSELLEAVIDHTKFYKHLDDGTAEGEARQQNVQELFSVASRYDGSETPLAAFLEGVALVADIDNYDTQQKSVTLMTIHASKGLEFPVVFLPGWEDGIFPSASSQFSHENLEEERRLGYVAITRAQKQCHILHAQQRMLFGKTNYSSPSKFISELDEECLTRVGYETTSQSFYRSREPQGVQTFSAPPSSRGEALWGSAGAENDGEYSIGMRIRHADFGEGTVIMIAGDVLTVAFSGQGVKKIVASVAPIEVVGE